MTYKGPQQVSCKVQQTTRSSLLGKEVDLCSERPSLVLATVVRILELWQLAQSVWLLQNNRVEYLKLQCTPRQGSGDDPTRASR